MLMLESESIAGDYTYKNNPTNSNKKKLRVRRGQKQHEQVEEVFKGAEILPDNQKTKEKLFKEKQLTLAKMKVKSKFASQATSPKPNN